jgi:hypothetical protein
MIEQQIPAWLDAAVDQRLAFMLERMGGKLPSNVADVIMTMLTEPPEGSAFGPGTVGDRWERTCDNCGTYCGDEDKFIFGVIMRWHEGTRVEITFGACANCFEYQ